MKEMGTSHEQEIKHTRSSEKTKSHRRPNVPQNGRRQNFCEEILRMILSDPCLTVLSCTPHSEQFSGCNLTTC